MGWRLTLTSSPRHSFRQAPSSLLFSYSSEPANLPVGEGALVLVRGLRGPPVALSMDGGDWSSPGCWAWDQRGTGQDGSSQAHPRPAAPHRLSQTCAPAAPITDKCSGVLACHSSSWQQEGSSRKWFIIPSFIRSALGSPRGEEPWDVQEEASASDGFTDTISAKVSKRKHLFASPGLTCYHGPSRISFLPFHLFLWIQQRLQLCRSVSSPEPVLQGALVIGTSPGLAGC